MDRIRPILSERHLLRHAVSVGALAVSVLAVGSQLLNPNSVEPESPALVSNDISETAQTIPFSNRQSICGFIEEGGNVFATLKKEANGQEPRENNDGVSRIIVVRHNDGRVFTSTYGVLLDPKHKDDKNVRGINEVKADDYVCDTNDPEKLKAIERSR